MRTSIGAGSEIPTEARATCVTAWAFLDAVAIANRLSALLTEDVTPKARRAQSSLSAQTAYRVPPWGLGILERASHGVRRVGQAFRSSRRLQQRPARSGEVMSAPREMPACAAGWTSNRSPS